MTSGLNKNQLDLPLVKPKVKIAVVDDDEAILNYLTEFCASQDYEVTTFNEAEVLLAKLRGSAKSNGLHTTPYDLFLCDVRLPGMSGLEFLKNVRKIYLDALVILISGYSDIREAISGIKIGAFDYLEKPLDLNRLDITLRNALKLRNVQRAVYENEVPIKYEGVLCQSPAMKMVYEVVRRAAPTDSNVLITGESGVGKEYVAKAVHDNSNRASKPFVSINCSAIPETLLESELFGHSKGSFTGAHQERPGLFAEADGGTLFLDEIGDLSLPLQAKLLRVVQERKIRPVGSNHFKSIDVRLVSATNKNLSQEVQDSRFREDLYYRLNVIPIHVPPLRQRKEDVLILAGFFLDMFCQRFSLPKKSFSSQVMEKLLRMPFRGNVRELQNWVERAVIFSEGQLIDIESIPAFSEIPELESAQGVLNSIGQDAPSLKELESLYIKSILEKHKGNKQMAARALGLSRRTLYRKIDEMQRTKSETA